MNKFLEFGQGCIGTFNQDFLHDDVVHHVPQVLGEFGKDGEAENIVRYTKFHECNFGQHLMHVADEFFQIAAVFVPHEFKPHSSLVVNRGGGISRDNLGPYAVRIIFFLGSDDRFEGCFTHVVHEDVYVLNVFLAYCIGGGTTKRNRGFVYLFHGPLVT